MTTRSITPTAFSSTESIDTDSSKHCLEKTNVEPSVRRMKNYTAALTQCLWTIKQSGPYTTTTHRKHTSRFHFFPPTHFWVMRYFLTAYRETDGHCCVLACMHDAPLVSQKWHVFYRLLILCYITFLSGMQRIQIEIKTAKLYQITCFNLSWLTQHILNLSYAPI